MKKLTIEEEEKIDKIYKHLNEISKNDLIDIIVENLSKKEIDKFFD